DKMKQISLSTFLFLVGMVHKQRVQAGLLAYGHRLLHLPVIAYSGICSLLPITVAGTRWIFTKLHYYDFRRNHLYSCIHFSLTFIIQCKILFSTIFIKLSI